jgi:hypothetical protein
MRGRTVRTPKKRQTFLNALASGASVFRACAAADISRRAAYDWRADDPDFSEAWDRSLDDGTDLIEDALLRRALEVSDTAAIFLLKARRPGIYRDPKPGVMTLSDADLQSVQQGRRLAEMSDAEKQQQIDEIIRRRQLAEANRAEEEQWFHSAEAARGNGQGHD